jgi:hypothetical protein
MTDRLRFSTSQAADYAGKHRDTILRALEAGELHGGQRMDKETGKPKKGGRWSIRRECLDAWLDGEACAHQDAAA